MNPLLIRRGAQLYISTLYLVMYCVMTYFRSAGTITVDDQSFGILTGLVPVIISFWMVKLPENDK